MDAYTLIVILIIIAVTFDFLNGFNDSANIVATMIASRAMSARGALAMAAVAEFIGPFIFGVAVANTIGSEVAAPHSLTIAVVFAALLSAITWNIIAWSKGIPSSSSHALIGGIIGAVLVSSGWQVINSAGLWKIGIALFTSPIIGFLAGMLVMFITRKSLSNATPKMNTYLKRAQIPAVILLALSHGANDAQKTMGVITLGLVVLGFQKEFHVPLWVIVVSATAISSGMAIGGQRIIRTIGSKFYRIRPIHGFASQTGSGLVIMIASLLGGPVSTAQVVSMSVLGAGAEEAKSQVRWGVLTDIALAWLLTIPLTGTLAALLYLVISRIV